MRRPRITLGWLMLGVALAGVPAGLLGSTLRNGDLPRMGLWPGLVAFGAATAFLAGRREERWPFLLGFAATGWGSLLAYVALWLNGDATMDAAIVFYFNDLGAHGFAWLTDVDSWEGYALNLLVMGLMLATPQLVAATVGGLVARRIWGARWTST